MKCPNPPAALSLSFGSSSPLRGVWRITSAWSFALELPCDSKFSAGVLIDEALSPRLHVVGEYGLHFRSDDAIGRRPVARWLDGHGRRRENSQSERAPHPGALRAEHAGAIRTTRRPLHRRNRSSRGV